METTTRRNNNHAIIFNSEDEILSDLCKKLVPKGWALNVYRTRWGSTLLIMSFFQIRHSNNLEKMRLHCCFRSLSYQAGQMRDYLMGYIKGNNLDEY